MGDMPQAFWWLDLVKMSTNRNEYGYGSPRRHDLITSTKTRPTLTMATNPPKGDGHRNGAVTGRSQTQTPSGAWVKRDTGTGRFMDVKSDSKPFKGVRKEQ